MDFSPYEKQHGLPRGLLNAVMRTESAGNPDAVSPRGAVGLFQFMPDTAAELGIDPKDPAQAAEGAARYLKQNYDKFGDWDKALAAYNAGPGNVRKYKGIPPFQETQNYVRKVNSTMAQDWRGRATPIQDTVQQPAVSGWRGRATAVQQPATSDWRTRAVAVQAAPEQQQFDPAFIDRLNQGYAARDAQVDEAINQYAAGNQTLPETVMQGLTAKASKITDTAGEALTSLPIVGPAVQYVGGKIAQGIGNLPLPSSENPNQTVSQYAGQVEQQYPRAARNIKSGLEALNVGAMLAGGSAALGPSAAKTAARTAVKSGKINAAGMRKLAGEQYDMANYLGANFTPDQVSNKFGRSINELKPKPIAGTVLTSEDRMLANNLDEYKDLVGKDLNLEDITRLDQSLTQKITSGFTDKQTGAPDANGRKLMMLQQQLREAVDAVPDTPGNAALINGRNLWAAQARMNDLEAIAERASLTLNPATAMQTGYRNLYMNKARIKGWPEEAKQLLKEAAKPGLASELLAPIASRLTAIISGGTGNIAGAAGAQIAGMAARGVREGIVAGRGAKVQNALVGTAMKKMRDVNVSEPKYSVADQLAAFDRSGKPLSTTKSPAVEFGKTLSKADRKFYSVALNEYQTGKISKAGLVKTLKSEFELSDSMINKILKEIQ